MWQVIAAHETDYDKGAVFLSVFGATAGLSALLYILLGRSVDPQLGEIWYPWRLIPIIALTAVTSWFTFGTRMWRTALKNKHIFDMKIAEVGLQKYALSEGERAYADVLLTLNKGINLNDTSLQELITQMNTLLQVYHRLEEKQKTNQDALNAYALDDLEVEHRNLIEQMNSAADPITKATFERSAEKCSNNINSIQALRLHQQRLSALMAEVVQNFKSARVTYIHQNNVSLTDIEARELISSFSEKVTQIQNYTQATEQAIEEIAILRLGGGR